MKHLFYTFLLVCVCQTAISQTVEEILVENNKKTRTSFIRKISSVRKGITLDSTQLDEDVRRLKQLPGIAHAYYKVNRTTSGNVEVVFGVEENFTIIPSANFYTTNDDEFAYRLGLYEFNALGRNIIVGGYFQRDIFNSFGLGLRAPYLFSRKLGISVFYQDLTTLEPVFLDQGAADYRYNNTGIEVLGLYEPSLRHRISAGVNFFAEDYSYLEGATDPDVPQGLNVDKVLFKGIYEYNKVDFYYYLLNGFKNELNLQYVISSDQVLPDFFIWRNDFIYYKRVGEKGNWANRLRIGLATNSDSPFAPFAVDNNLNIRGVGNTIDRGTGSIVLNTEFRYTLFEKKWFVLQGNAFIDSGSWRNPGGDLSDFGDNQNLRVYPGLGVRFIHKFIFNTVFRIDYGYGITKDATRGFVFGIGQYF
ncbi:POTRA domain-containing protein [Aureitalea marina]|uniref:Outer membrane protein assembly factor n=1 Tax=Aureitalea marina TaxID=930804 RepID=A0A2S7KLN9_9FLAO|nr:POTRA domain-containing protein [Aureitalea marina]PQB03518.1 outer membrane protein assembly factor [Aureitalea marina]